MTVAYVVYHDEPTGAQLLRIPGQSRLIWWVDMGKMDCMSDIVARYRASSAYHSHVCNEHVCNESVSPPGGE
jgi:hypothetical protein